MSNQIMSLIAYPFIMWYKVLKYEDLWCNFWWPPLTGKHFALLKAINIININMSSINPPHRNSSTKFFIQTVWAELMKLCRKHQSECLSIVQDRYDITNPLKASTHAGRGAGLRRIITKESLVRFSYFAEWPRMNARLINWSSELYSWCSGLHLTS